METVALTGDSVVSDLSDINAYNIIITTPEKWDSLTRKWNENKAAVQTIKLMLIDEIHMLNDGKRGASIEAIVARAKTFDTGAITVMTARHTGQPYDDLAVEFAERRIRFITVSAGIANLDDVAQWIGAPMKMFQ